MSSLHQNKVPTLSIGLLTAPEVEINFIEGFEFSGLKRFTAADIDNRQRFNALSDSVFEVHNVVIGIGFHWQQQENQRFTGDIELIRCGDNIVVVNHIDIESYLKSVISSEMKATASEALLKAHAVISRSWVLRQVGRAGKVMSSPGYINDNDEIIRWYDREDHDLFDVCADDHCQRYQGITRQTTPAVNAAVEATRGMVLTHEGHICDARFSKCCGGATELFTSCWGEESHPYLDAFTDTPSHTATPELTNEENAQQWIECRPDAFCNTSDPTILTQVLNNYDQTTTDFYRWSVTTNGRELGALIRSKAGIELGDVTELTPLQRGASGRITRLRITGTLRTVIVGKELEIRRWLSPTHLYSSAFVVERTVSPDSDKEPVGFTLRGAGWGHGVGLCQIGAAVMGAQGYQFTDILSHYYPNAIIQKIYE